MKKAFTLVELLVVIGILGVLTAVLLGSFSGSTDSAKAAKCLANLHNLGVACSSYAASEGNSSLPAAGDWTGYKRKNGQANNTVHHGWIGSKTHNTIGHISTYSDNYDDRHSSLTNGCLWKVLNRSTDAYVCPLHRAEARKRGVTDPCWSYVMNGWFQYGEKLRTNANRYLREIDNAERMLLFAEMPFISLQGQKGTSLTISPSYNASPSEDNDMIIKGGSLKYGGSENIGVNHRVGKNWYAHVCFVDGHTEKLLIPKDLDEGQLRSLSTWLCDGESISFNGKQYEKVSE